MSNPELQAFINRCMAESSVFKKEDSAPGHGEVLIIYGGSQVVKTSLFELGQRFGIGKSSLGRMHRLRDFMNESFPKRADKDGAQEVRSTQTEEK